MTLTRAMLLTAALLGAAAARTHEPLFAVAACAFLAAAIARAVR